ncbi:hypothetical protein G7054_g11275 [Neopestalotiopsis clavispora]|nr:hypothetical protein G7054_g11275 [Neopestalotiopsis clavispora]
MRGKVNVQKYLWGNSPSEWYRVSFSYHISIGTCHNLHIPHRSQQKWQLSPYAENASPRLRRLHSDSPIDARRLTLESPSPPSTTSYVPEKKGYLALGGGYHRDQSTPPAEKRYVRSIPRSTRFAAPPSTPLSSQPELAISSWWKEIEVGAWSDGMKAVIHSTGWLRFASCFDL